MEDLEWLFKNYILPSLTVIAIVAFIAWLI